MKKFEELVRIVQRSAEELSTSIDKDQYEIWRLVLEAKSRHITITIKAPQGSLMVSPEEISANAPNFVGISLPTPLTEREVWKMLESIEEAPRGEVKIEVVKGSRRRYPMTAL